ncbi:MAG: NCS2 family permease [Candidatus Omnitrophica bacterium]|nr:NCS2 family permease [Candidatus Omnitrophota bacterium]
MTNSSPKSRWFVPQDLDGFFGLAIDNLVQLIVIVNLCATVCGMPDSLIYGRILPGTAVAVILGNLFYSWQAKRLMEKTGREDVTALPYGINTPSVFAYVFLVIAPVYAKTQDAELAWKVGLAACVGSGIIEFIGSFFAEWIRKHTPRAALLSTLAGIAITFIAMDFALKIFALPLIAFLPLGILLLQYLTGLRYPFGIPGGLLAVIVGTLIAWLGVPFGYGPMDPTGIGSAVREIQLRIPDLSVGSLLQSLSTQESYAFFSIILPMGLFNVVGSLQNIESAEAAGDRYSATSSLAVNGIGTLVGAAFGSCFPTTIYIGHPGWKRMGARAGYSIYNAVFIAAVCFLGAMPLVLALIPLEAAVAILLWIGIIITAQAFQTTPKEHAPAVAVGLFPSVAAWGFLMISGAAIGAGKSLEEIAPALSFPLAGMIALNQGFILTCMIWSAVTVALIERRFTAASVWMVVAAALSSIGILHAYQFEAGSVVNHFGIWVAPEFTISYLLLAGLFLGFGAWLEKHPQPNAEPFE